MLARHSREHGPAAGHDSLAGIAQGTVCKLLAEPEVKPHWVAQSARNADRGDGGLTTAERDELNRLRRENRQLRVEQDILSKAAAWFARETNAIPAKGSGS